MCCFFFEPTLKLIFAFSAELKYIVLKVKTVYGAGVCQCLGLTRPDSRSAFFKCA